ncbi:hypothetical protein ABZP36_035234 [Zizania latifolia]
MAAMASSGGHIAVFLALVLVFSGTEAKFLSNNITVVGSVYCDACSNNTFSKHSFFLKGARVLIQCNFKVNSTMTEELSLEAERTTDQNGVYKLDVPAVDGFECREGHDLRSACRATLVRSSSAACNVPGLRGSTQHITLRSRATNACFLNLNALNFRPAKLDGTLCHDGGGWQRSVRFVALLLAILAALLAAVPVPVPRAERRRRDGVVPVAVPRAGLAGAVPATAVLAVPSVPAGARVVGAGAGAGAAVLPLPAFPKSSAISALDLPHPQETCQDMIF